MIFLFFIILSSFIILKWTPCKLKVLLTSNQVLHSNKYMSHQIYKLQLLFQIPSSWYYTPLIHWSQKGFQRPSVSCVRVFQKHFLRRCVIFNPKNVTICSGLDQNKKSPSFWPIGLEFFLAIKNSCKMSFFWPMGQNYIWYQSSAVKNHLLKNKHNFLSKRRILVK